MHKKDLVHNFSQQGCSQVLMASAAISLLYFLKSLWLRECPQALAEFSDPLATRRFYNRVFVISGFAAVEWPCPVTPWRRQCGLGRDLRKTGVTLVVQERRRRHGAERLPPSYLRPASRVISTQSEEPPRRDRGWSNYRRQWSSRVRLLNSVGDSKLPTTVRYACCTGAVVTQSTQCRWLSQKRNHLQIGLPQIGNYCRLFYFRITYDDLKV